MNAHTPGPWFLYWDGGRPHGIGIYQGTDATDAKMCVLLVNPSAPPTKANAVLIAEAPAMLEALEKLLTVCRYSAPEKPGGEYNDQMIDNAKAVIARVKGGQK